ncbi:unnamed protein product [Xylocopa violacea]|uniref:Chitin-binding type-2 domain-containing protein n=1 Tax=Xylocopa violacea TaxID=135666 RepID=A0ABP1NEB4_XYLVO
MKNSIPVLLLFALIVILIVVSQPVKKLADIDDTVVTNYGLHRYPRHLKLKSPTCRNNQYFDKAESRCLGIIGGGKVLYLNNTKSCGTNVLKPHCTNPRYYYICKQNKTILVECPNNRHFENRLQKCVLVPRKEYVSDTMQLNLDTFDSTQFSDCKRPGSFSVPGECALFYTCTQNGYRMYRNFYRCPRNMAYDAETEMCSPSSTCEGSRFPSLCLLNDSSFTVQKDGTSLICETMYTNGEVIPTVNTSETATASHEIAAISVDETTITSSKEMIRAMLNDDEVAFTTVASTGSIEPLVSGDNNDVANTMERTQEMSRSSNMDDSTSTTLYSTSMEESTFGKKTNFLIEQQDSITTMKEISKQSVAKDETTNTSPLILPNLLTSSITEKEVRTIVEVHPIPCLMTSDNTEIQVKTKTTGTDESMLEANTPKELVLDNRFNIMTANNVTLNTTKGLEQNIKRATKQLSIEDEITAFISTISATSEFNNKNAIYGSTKLSTDKFSILFDSNEKSTTDLVNMVTTDEDLLIQNSSAIMTETNVVETSTNFFVTGNTYTASMENIGFTNFLNESKYSKIDFYNFTFLNGTDATNYSDHSSSSTEKIDEFKSVVEIEPAVTNFTFSLDNVLHIEGTSISNTSSTMVSIPNMFNNRFTDNVTQISSIVSVTDSTFFVDDTFKSTMLSKSPFSITSGIVLNKNGESNASSVIEHNIMKTTFPMEANEIFTTTVYVDNIENVTDGSITASINTSLGNSDAINVENVIGGSTNVFIEKMFPNVNANNINNATTEKSSIVSINTFPAYINLNSAEIVIDGFTIGSTHNMSVNNSSINNIASVTERSAPFIDRDKNQSRRPVIQKNTLTATIRPSTSLEDLFAICKAHGLTEAITETSVSDLINMKEYSKLLDKNSWNTGKDETSGLNGNIAEKKSTSAPKQMHGEKAVLKNTLLPITSMVLNIVDKLELHIRDILKKLLH